MIRAGLGDEGQQIGLGVFRDDAQDRARLSDQPRLGQRLFAAADDGHGFALDPHEDGEGVELGSGVRHGRERNPEQVCSFTRGREKPEGTHSRIACRDAIAFLKA